MNKLFITFLLCLPLFSWAGKDGNIKVLKKGDVCPKFVFKDVDGEKMSLEQFKGKYVVIDVWASWCQPCKQEFPNLKKLEEKYKDKNIVFVSISSDAQERRWRFELGFLRERLELQWWIVGNENFMRAFEIAGQGGANRRIKVTKAFGSEIREDIKKVERIMILFLLQKLIDNEIYLYTVSCGFMPWDWGMPTRRMEGEIYFDRDDGN